LYEHVETKLEIVNGAN